jgi:hypothetical protein
VNTNFEVVFGWVGENGYVRLLEREMACEPSDLDVALMKLRGHVEEGTGRRLYIRSISRQSNGNGHSPTNGMRESAKGSGDIDGYERRSRR